MPEGRPHRFGWEDEPERYWREGDLLACDGEADLPSRCVACNESTGRGRVRFRVRVRPRGETRLGGLVEDLLMLGGPAWTLFALIEARFRAGRDISVLIAHCSDHARRRLLGSALTGLALLGLLGAPLLALLAVLDLVALEPARAAWAWLLVPLALPGLLLRRSVMPRVVDSSPSRVRLRVDERFLRSIPEREAEA